MYAKNLTPITKNIYEISSNVNEFFIIKSKKKLISYISSKVSDIYIKRTKTPIIKEENEQTKKPMITKINSSQSSKKLFLNLNISSEESKICILKIHSKPIFKLLNIVSSINRLDIISKTRNKFKIIEICKNNEKFTLKPLKKELKISFNLNKINLCPDEKMKKILFMKKLFIVSNISNINIIKKTKKLLLSITSKVSEIIIRKNKLKNIIYRIENQQLSLINFKKKKIQGRTTTQKAIIDNYINSINIGFDNNKIYDDNNIINKENDDDDSDNENDKLECEPVPSFILCIQKKEKVK